MSEIQPKTQNKKLWIWIIIGIISLVIMGGLIYYFAKPKKNSSEQPTNNPININQNHLPSLEQAEKEIQQIKTSKNLNPQQAAFEFLASYVPQLRYWELNSLTELDEKLNQINNKTGIPPFSAIPSADEFNEQAESYFQLKVACFMVALMPRKTDNPNSIDWDYLKEMEQGSKQKPQYHPNFATQANYQELSRCLSQEINPNLASLCNKFANLSTVSELNNLVNNYLGKIFIGTGYSLIHEGLAEQLKLTDHNSFELDKTGNSSTNSKWGIVLYEFAFLKGDGNE